MRIRVFKIRLFQSGVCIEYVVYTIMGSLIANSLIATELHAPEIHYTLQYNTRSIQCDTFTTCATAAARDPRT